MTLPSDPYDHRGAPDPDPYSEALRPLQRSAQTPTAIGTKSLKRLKNARRAALEGGRRLAQWDEQVLAVVEWAIGSERRVWLDSSWIVDPSIGEGDASKFEARPR